MKQFRSVIVLLCAALLLSACATGERSDQRSRRPSPQAAARDALVAELSARARAEAAGGGVDAASRSALGAGLSVPSSFREQVRFPLDAPYVVAYRMTLRRGDVLRVRIDDLEGGGPLVAEVFQPTVGDLFRPVHAVPEGTRALRFEAHASGEYVLRLQPGPGGGGLYEIVVEGGAPLPFPVAGADLTAVGSWFGDPRDAGARGHEGIDIFAPRGTPVLAVASGRVATARSTPVGGKVVWLEDADSELTYYYAHLDDYRVREGDWVGAGDVIGTVGNTGNARGVRPHLHFGVYRPGRVALDPAPMLVSPLASHGVGATADASMLGRWARVNSNRVRLRNAPSPGGAILAELTPATPFRVLGGIADWHRIQLPDGTSGFVAARFTTLEDQTGW